MAAIGRSNYKQVLKKVERETPARLSKALQATAIEGINRLVDRTPVDTGAAKFHWFVRLVPDERFDKERTDPSGAQPKARAKRDVKLFRIGQTVWLVNSAPYFVYLEAGSSKQAPQGIVAITLAEMQLLWQKENQGGILKGLQGIVSYAIATSTSEVRAVIEPAVESVWTGLGYTSDTIEWPNTYFVKPGNGAWIRVTFPQWSTAAFTWSAGTVQNTTIGILAIQVFAPRNAGDALLIAASDALRAAFERRSFGDGIRFRESLGPNDTAFEQQWAGRAFLFPFEFIEDIAL